MSISDYEYGLLVASHSDNCDVFALATAETTIVTSVHFCPSVTFAFVICYRIKRYQFGKRPHRRLVTHPGCELFRPMLTSHLIQSQPPNGISIGLAFMHSTAL